VLAPATYIQRLESCAVGAWPYPLSPAVAQSSVLAPDDAMGETMMMGLRLTREGVTNSGFEHRFGVALGERYRRELKRLRERGLLEWDGERARLTRTGRLLGNQVFREFVG
jgi:oxygen-independent coproporphyrinogen-3 oxidase